MSREDDLPSWDEFGAEQLDYGGEDEEEVQAPGDDPGDPGDGPSCSSSAASSAAAATATARSVAAVAAMTAAARAATAAAPRDIGPSLPPGFEIGGGPEDVDDDNDVEDPEDPGDLSMQQPSGDEAELAPTLPSMGGPSLPIDEPTAPTAAPAAAAAQPPAARRAAAYGPAAPPPEPEPQAARASTRRPDALPARVMGPAMPPDLLPFEANGADGQDEEEEGDDGVPAEEDDDDAFGPALPPGMNGGARSAAGVAEMEMPTMEEDDDDVIGPMPARAGGTPKRPSKGGVETEVKVKREKKEETTVEDAPMEETKKVIDPQDLYAIEDKIASELGTTVMTDRMKESTSVLREILEKFIGGETPAINMKSATVATIQLRRYSRLIYYANAIKKKEVTQKMEVVESKYMQLQNQSSQVGHLQKEIERCLLYPSNDEQISLVPLDEFYEKAKPEMSKPEITKNDEHQQKVARLNFEREERKHLMNTLNELEFRRSVLASDINKKESRIKSLKPRMDSVVKSTRLLEEALGMKPSSSDRQSPYFHLLPPQLSVLYVQAEAYKQLVEDTLVTVSVGGDTGEANRLKEKKEEEAEEGTDMEGVDEGGPEGDEDSQEESEKGRGSTLEKKRALLLRPHPMYLTIEIGCIEECKVRLKLQFLPELGISVLKWKMRTPNCPNFGSLKTSSMMDDLFIGDDGLTCPNAIGAAKMNQLKVNFSSLSKSIGRPYRFVQKMTGCRDEDSGSELSEELERLMVAVRERVKTRVEMALALTDMDKGRMDQLLEKEGLSTIEGISLKKVNTITDEEFIAKIPQSTCTLLKTNEQDPFLHLSFVFTIPNGEMRVLAALWSDFPTSSALVSFSLDREGEIEMKTEENMEELKTIQSFLREEWSAEERKDVMACLLKELMKVAAKMGGIEVKKEEEKEKEEREESMETD